MRIDGATGNVGIGTTPNTKFHISSTTTTKSVIETTGTTSDALIEFTKGQGSGNTWSMGIDHSNSSAFSLAYLSNGSPSLTTHGLVTVDTSGNLGIGTTTVNSKLNVASSQDSLKYNEGVTVFRSTGSNKMFLNCVGGGANIVGSNSPITFNYHDQTTNNVTEAARIVSGNLLVGKDTTGLADAGFEVQSSGQITASQTNAPAAKFNRLTNDGEIIRLHKDGTTVGSIGSRSGVVSTIVLNPASGNGAGLSGGTKTIVPADEAGIIDNDISLGISTHRFKDLYLSGGVYLGGTGAANKLDDYEEGTFTPTFGGSTTNPTVTYAVQSGVYTKIGNMITATCVIGISANTGGAGSIQIKGLPFTAKNDAEYRAKDMINTYNLDVDTNCIGVGIEGVQNADYLLLLESRDNAAWRQVTWTQATAADIYFSFTFQYYV
jgi:hypothetical protein